MISILGVFVKEYREKVVKKTVRDKREKKPII